MALSIDERERFLAQPHVAALSVAAGADRGPLTVPIWYQYSPGGEAWILTQSTGRKTGLIEAAGRFSLMVQRVEPTVRYVSVEGPVTRTVPMTDALLAELAHRYLPEEKAGPFMEISKSEHGDQVVIFMRPERWFSSDLGAF
ncbi:pyridoxamine 5'-phosphate oxidase family protein [Actinobacteria bacterium YIM 96077]|uniref:Pyridoxamine 5'-phosphate oxidase family protein n=1 Tax=Phytoactinopolyspora halophila TaxID=1981511 RepID=A0A329R616_9ACTN|nr:pyridoxamine 5'-phosphate oxidase family protein [Phytoactinopolyspora halophila]AYY11885.1 pyridoxamine 5'-phosphate oxidase family protein [Actinobacteria bacterium YIM 96077]RAW18882.1 pyridoxamine 5'-phosphate oxidase family protein [Phytoactinopolyspora halophila]